MSETDWPRAFLVDLDNTLHDYSKTELTARLTLAQRVEDLCGAPADEVLKYYEQLIKAEEGTVARSARDMRMERMQKLIASARGAAAIRPEGLVAALEDSLLGGLTPFDGAIE